MSLTAKAGASGEYKLVPEGTHLARCYLMVDIGLQETTFKGETSRKLKVVVGWEIPGETLDDGRPMSITSQYTNSLHERAILRQHLESWRGKKFTESELGGFDLRNIVGAPCMITVTHNTPKDMTFANVVAVTAVPAGLPVPDAVNEPVVYDIDEDGPARFVDLPEWIQRKITERKRDDDAPEPAQAEAGFDDDIPF